jgi:hypothetical protein
VLLAGLLWKKTTVSQSCIAEYLNMKNAANVSRAIHLMALSWIEKKGFCKIGEVYMGKNERK